MDTIIAVVLVLAWRDSLVPWKVILITLVLMDCLIHVEFFMRNDTSFRSKYNYDLTLNLVYISKVACVAIPSVWLLWNRKPKLAAWDA
jgi:heme/copper-type cytochrome/quinol oxidase subunit 4